jgi:FkbM family methyltransferase
MLTIRFIGALAYYGSYIVTLLHLVNGQANWSSKQGEYHLVTLPNATFYVGEVHHQWCLTAEREQVELFQEKLSQVRSNCTVIDVGMNDGFYTQMAGSFGCRVYSFELQPLCIEISQAAAKRNGIDHLVNITRAPVSSISGSVMQMLFPEHPLCDGGFSFSGPNAMNTAGEHLASHSKMKLSVLKNLTSVALSTFPPVAIDVFINLIKIDVEGHEAEVLEGALPLLKQRRVDIMIVELGPMWEYSDPVKLVKIYRHIVMDLGYTLTSFNCKDYVRRGGPEIFNKGNFDSNFEKYAYFNPMLQALWRCPDLLIQASKNE